ncbi:hypothetical protein LTR53_010720 [Teratosphaeriaceae sp. CCFEE 6253]|nr:hypothetical protein LTR53_010720 [Teratosphaeriaceae sp. CCFEE 6253]
MGFWRRSQPAQVPTALTAQMDHGEEITAEVDEEPDERRHRTAPKTQDMYAKTRPSQQMFNRRESLLTRQLHSETEHSDAELPYQPPRTLSTQSTWSNPSTASTAELTSDDGISMPSPAISPPLRATQPYTALPGHEQTLDGKVKAVGLNGAEKGTLPEKTVEATLGRKRCIMFACRGKEETKPPKAPSPTSAPAPPPAPVAVSPPKRKCAIKFACPMRAKTESKPSETTPAKRPMSPPPQRVSSALKVETASKVHRGSDSTVTHASPTSVRKSPNVITTAPTPNGTETSHPMAVRKLSNDSDEAGTEACRFHEFASSEDEPEAWIKEVGCPRSRLTINDTLKKEISIRKVCEEADEEVLEEDDDEDDGDADDVDGVERLDDGVDEEGNDEEEDESDESDAGFHSDDEEGFAASDSEGEDSDYEWWRPGGSTAATSTDHLDRLSTQHKSDEKVLSSSMNSMSSGQVSPRASKRPSYRRPRNHARSSAIPIGDRLEVRENEGLPDSTDFVCGTLDEDRPLEQAYINRKKCLEAARHKACPQDIDPTFPTSDPDMDEEDDEDLEDPEESEPEEDLMHGDMDEVHESSTLRRRPSIQRRGTTHRSPPPPARHPSPAPAKRHSRIHSPPPPTKRMSTKSPPPRNLFAHSPRRNGKSPAPRHPMTSPPNTRHSSPTGAAVSNAEPGRFAARTNVTHTSSLPRHGFLISQLGHRKGSEDGEEGSDTASAQSRELPKRGAIDIVRGLEKKRARREEKMHRRLCGKETARQKVYKVKPGKGCERMREVGLQLQEWHGHAAANNGKAEHILSL